MSAPTQARPPRKPRPRKTTVPPTDTIPVEEPAPNDTTTSGDSESASPEQEQRWPMEEAWWLIVQRSEHGALDQAQTVVRVEPCRVCYAIIDHGEYEDHLVWHARRG